MLLDQNGNSSLLSLVKALESVLSVYEGFCNLKQVRFGFLDCWVRNDFGLELLGA